MAKTNIRSIRFSDELADLIDRQVGETFTQKFENLVTRCVWELPQKEKELQKIQDQINQKRKELENLQRASRQLNELSQYLETTKRYMTCVERTAKSIAENCNTD